MIQLTNYKDNIPEYWINPEHISEIYSVDGVTHIGILSWKYAEKVRESPAEVLTKIKLFKEKNNG